MSITEGDIRFLDRVLKVVVKRVLPDGKVIVSVGTDTQVVDAVNLTSEEF